MADRSGDANIVSAVSPTLFCTNFSDYSKDDGLICRIDAPSDDAVDKCTVIRAAAKDSAGNWSAVTTQTYFIGSTTDHIDGIEAGCKASGSDLAVISITMDYDDLLTAGKAYMSKAMYSIMRLRSLSAIRTGLKRMIPVSLMPTIRSAAVNGNARLI